jgi:hypothetical protein
MATNQDVNTPVIAVVGFLGIILLSAVILLLQVIYYQVEARQSYEKNAGERPPELSNLVEAQQAQLAEYRWADPQQKVVAVPIDRAMDLVVKEQTRQSGRSTRSDSGGEASPAPQTNRAKEPPVAKEPPDAK